MDPGKQVIKEEFGGASEQGQGKEGGHAGHGGHPHRIRRKGSALKAAPCSRSPSGSPPPASSPSNAGSAPAREQHGSPLRSPLRSPRRSPRRSPTPTPSTAVSAATPGPATAAALGVNGYTSRLLNGGSPGPGPDRHAGGASPPSQPLALSLSLWERAGRDAGGTASGTAATPGATPGGPPGGAPGGAAATAATPAGTAFSSARSHAKMKRFLSTLVQFGSDISADTGERVRALVFSLVANGLSVEEFQHSLQEVTNFPLRGFVLPFLRGQLPALQRELHGLAKAAGESALQYLRHHEHLLLDPASVSPAGEGVLNIFHADGKDATKRPASDSLEEAEEAENLSAWSKRAHISNPLALDRADRDRDRPADRDRDRDRTSERTLERPERTERALVRGGGGVVHPRARHIPPPPHLQAHLHPQHPAQHAKEAEERRNSEDEWKNINVMLNCVLSMVEKTKHALVILQQRGTVSADGAAHENGVVALTAASAAGAAGAAVVSRQIKAAVDDIMARTLQDTEERIADLKRRAEETVNEVRRQAVMEIQRAVAAAEAQAAELMAAERANLERRLAGLGAGVGLGALQARLDAVAHNGHSPPAERLAHTANSCWNCGRKAQETCSGCNVARYCGAFCQHKDWETHHQVCALRVAASVAATSAAAASAPDSAAAMWAAEQQRAAAASAPPAPAPRPATSPTAHAAHAMVAVSKTSPQK